jgi:hypothetical protein
VSNEIVPVPVGGQPIAGLNPVADQIDVAMNSGTTVLMSPTKIVLDYLGNHARDGKLAIMLGMDEGGDKKKFATMVAGFVETGWWSTEPAVVEEAPVVINDDGSKTRTPFTLPDDAGFTSYDIVVEVAAFSVDGKAYPASKQTVTLTRERVSQCVRGNYRILEGHCRSLALIVANEIRKNLGAPTIDKIPVLIQSMVTGLDRQVMTIKRNNQSTTGKKGVSYPPMIGTAIKLITERGLTMEVRIASALGLKDNRTVCQKVFSGAQTCLLLNLNPHDYDKWNSFSQVAARKVINELLGESDFTRSWLANLDRNNPTVVAALDQLRPLVGLKPSTGTGDGSELAPVAIDQKVAIALVKNDAWPLWARDGMASAGKLVDEEQREAVRVQFEAIQLVLDKAGFVYKPVCITE